MDALLSLGQTCLLCPVLSGQIVNQAGETAAGAGVSDAVLRVMRGIPERHLNRLTG